MEYGGAAVYLSLREGSVHGDFFARAAEVDFKGELFFAASSLRQPPSGSPVYEIELWKSDGTPTGTTLVHDFDLTSNSTAWGVFHLLTVIGNKLFISYQYSYGLIVFLLILILNNI